MECICQMGVCIQTILFLEIYSISLQHLVDHQYIYIDFLFLRSNRTFSSVRSRPWNSQSISSPNLSFATIVFVFRSLLTGLANTAASRRSGCLGDKVNGNPLVSYTVKLSIMGNVDHLLVSTLHKLSFIQTVDSVGLRFSTQYLNSLFNDKTFHISSLKSFTLSDRFIIFKTFFCFVR